MAQVTLLWRNRNLFFLVVMPKNTRTCFVSPRLISAISSSSNIIDNYPFSFCSVLVSAKGKPMKLELVLCTQ